MDWGLIGNFDGIKQMDCWLNKRQRWIRTAKGLFMAMLLASMACSGDKVLQAAASALPEESAAADDYKGADAKSAGIIKNPVYS